MAYVTKQGQTWDQISYEVYGTEMNAGRLMEANKKHLEIFVFPSGIRLETPEVEEAETDIPPWRKSDG